MELFRNLARAAPTSSRLAPGWTCRQCRVPGTLDRASPSPRTFSSAPALRLRERQPGPSQNTTEPSAHSQPAADVSQNVSQAEKNHFDRIESESKDKQMRAPWMREGSDKPPVARHRSAGAMTKGKLLTTPSRMLKLILPLTTRDKNKDRKDVEPLALLVHPQQPLSYLERLIQSEIPALEERDSSGREKVPKVTFRAQDTTEEDIGSGKSAIEEEEEREDEEDQLDRGGEKTRIDGKVEKTGKIRSSNAESQDAALPAHGHAESSSSQSSSDEPVDPEHPDFVRWSPSTEIGDFIRDAARGKEFAVDIEGAPPIYVGVPSFNDRTYYLRTRLRKTANKILKMTDIKHECDKLAHRGGQRMAQSGGVALIGWWAVVYYLTFQTSLGWDVMEPVTYLVGLSGIMSGYMWFLYHNREVSYRSALNFTVSRRQAALYKQKGFDIQQWEALVEEGNRLRREVKLVAEEYDVEWDETKDEGDAKVSEALRKEREKKREESGDGKKEKKGKEEDDD